MEQLTAPVKGFKVFNPDRTCRDKQYTCPGEFKEDVKPMACSAGMPNVWVWDSDMTDEEKEAHPEYKTTGGFLKVLDTSDCCVRWWENLDEYQRRIIRSIPNFDAAIFKQITGIDA